MNIKALFMTVKARRAARLHNAGGRHIHFKMDHRLQVIEGGLHGQVDKKQTDFYIVKRSGVAHQIDSQGALPVPGSVTKDDPLKCLVVEIASRYQFNVGINTENL
jgi:hypothetical protein